MDQYQQFKESIAQAVTHFKSFNKKETIRVISHYDADGISACSILIKMLNMQQRKYAVSVVPQLTEQILKECQAEKYKHYIFTDLGSSQLNLIRTYLPDRKILILDHHKVQKSKQQDTDSLKHINPHLCDIDGSKEVSGAGVVYLFAKAVEPSINMAHIAIIGALGDAQENNGFMKINSEILTDAIENKKISVIQDLRFFGTSTRAIHRVLEHSNDLVIPGVSGSEENALAFLKQLRINLKKRTQWRTLNDLSASERKRLIDGIIAKRGKKEAPEDLMGNSYILLAEPTDSPTRNAREFSTILNACGRLGKSSLGIGTCLGDKNMKKRAIVLLREYKTKIVQALEWYKAHKKSDSVITNSGYIIINAKDNILPTVIGTFASILSNSRDIPNNTLIMSLAQTENKMTKVSIRISGKGNKNLINLHTIVKSIVQEVGGYSGGHKLAAGALIPTEKEQAFIETAKRIFERAQMEESVC